MANLIRCEKRDHLCTLTIARPEVRNALSLGVIKELAAHTSALAEDKSIWTLIITGDGDKAFSAGADLKERLSMTEVEALDFVRSIQKTFQQFAEFPMPTIAAINGDAFGGGLELALACDLRVVSEKANIGLTETSLGIIPGAGGTQRLPRLIGLSKAMEMIFSAQRFNGQEALRHGLVNHVASDAEQTRMKALELASTLLKNAPLALKAAKKALLAASEGGLKEGLVSELAAYHEILDSDDRKEGLKAFQEKRPPRFRGV
jgi:enoyl-CoA hydratase/carnithine racemase